MKRKAVVLVTIDLARVLTRQGESERAAQLAAECYAILKNWGLHQDALAAWLVLQQALSHHVAVGDLFERLGTYYRRHWFTPALFDAGQA